MPPIPEDYDLGPYHTIKRLPPQRKDDLVEAWLSRLPDMQEVVLNILRIPHGDLGEEHLRAHAALQNEVRILKRARHLNIARIYPLHPRAVSLQVQGERYLSQHDFRDETWWFWAMEHLEGDSLARRMRRRRLPLEEAAEVIYQIAAALDYIHSKGIVHLNIHPKNIFFRYPLSGADLRVELVLTGFANGAGADQEIVDGRVAEGKFRSYVPPECIEPDRASDQPLDNRPKDVYSLGVLFYRMLAGVPPFTGSDEDVDRAIVDADPPPLMRFDVPAGVEDLIFQSLQKDPAKRPSMEHLLINLDKSVPPPRVMGSRVRIPSSSEGGALPEYTRAHTVPYTSSTAGSASQRFGVVAGEEVVPPAPKLRERLKNRWQRLRRKGPYPAPKLLEPAEGVTIEGPVTFAWHWKRKLKDNEAFELRVWKEGGRHGRAGEPQRESEMEIDLDTLVDELPGEGDECFWSVAVVQHQPHPYRSLSKEAKPRSFVYGEPSAWEVAEEEAGDGTDDLADVGTSEGDLEYAD